MILDAIRGKGVGRGGPRIGKGGPRIGPPPFIGAWCSGRGGAQSPRLGYRDKKKKTKGQGLLLGKNSPFKGIPLVGDIM